MKRRVLTLISLLAVASLVATACAPRAPAPAATPLPAAATPLPAEKVTITWYVRTSPEEQPWQENVVIPAFERLHPNIKINLVVSTWDEFDTKMNAMFAAGEGPDIWSHWGPSGFADYLHRGMIQDLTPFIERDNFDLTDFVPEVLELYKVEGRIYGLPLLAGASYIFYNKDLFDEAGVPYPPADWEDQTWTWDRFREMGQKLSKDVDDPTKAVWGMTFGIWPNDAWAWMFGKDLYPPEAYKTGFADTAYLDDPDVVRAFQARADLTWKYKVAPSPAAEEALAAGGNPFHTGRVGMNPIGVWGWWVHKGLEEQFRFGCAALPKGAPNARAVIFCDPWMLSATSKHPDEAWEFLKYLLSVDAQRAYMEAVGAPPVRKSLLPEFFKLYPSMTPEEAETCFVGGVRHGFESPNHLLVRFDLLNRVVTAALDPVFLGEKTAAETLPQANRELIEALRDIKAEYEE
jgi:multiple sugar transport system substrate-binding protein